MKTEGSDRGKGNKKAVPFHFRQPLGIKIRLFQYWVFLYQGATRHKFPVETGPNTSAPVRPHAGFFVPRRCYCLTPRDNPAHRLLLT